jgi:hypothetical protein
MGVVSAKLDFTDSSEIVASLEQVIVGTVGKQFAAVHNEDFIIFSNQLS